MGTGAESSPSALGGTGLRALTSGAVRLGCFVPQGWRHDLPSELSPESQWEAMVEVALRAERSGYEARLIQVQGSRAALRAFKVQEARGMKCPIFKHGNTHAGMTS